MKTIAIRADANEADGTGHMMRCLALAEAFENTRIILVYHQAPPALLARYENLGAQLYHLKSQPYGKDDAQECNTLPCDWLIVDGYRFDAEFFESLQIKSAVLDDFARPPVMKADLVINPNTKASPDWYTPNQTTLLGPGFVPLRKEFRTNDTPKVPGRILFTSGGGDDLNITPLVIRKLRDLIDLSVIIGPANTHRDELVAEFSEQVELLENVSNMAEEIASSSMVICGAGSTIWECLSLSTPLLPIILADNQIPNQKFLLEEGFAISGCDARASDFLKNLRDSVEQFIKHPETARHAANKGSKLIDGQGAHRIFEQLIKL